jgi:hypothetical protein
VQDTVKKVGKNVEKRGGKGKISRVQKLAIFTILTARVDVAGYLGQFHFLNTSEKSRGLDFKPFWQNPTYGLKGSITLAFCMCSLDVQRTVCCNDMRF